MFIEIVISATSGLIGAAIGSFASYKTMVTQFEMIKEQELKKQTRDDELYLKRKREETYCRILRTYFELNKSKSFPTYQTDLDTWVADLYPYVNVYATQNIKDIYNDIVHKTGNHEDVLIEAIRKELGIRD